MSNGSAGTQVSSAISSFGFFITTGIVVDLYLLFFGPIGNGASIAWPVDAIASPFVKPYLVQLEDGSYVGCHDSVIGRRCVNYGIRENAYIDPHHVPFGYKTNAEALAIWPLRPDDKSSWRGPAGSMTDRVKAWLLWS